VTRQGRTLAPWQDRAMTRRLGWTAAAVVVALGVGVVVGWVVPRPGAASAPAGTRQVVVEVDGTTPDPTPGPDGCVVLPSICKDTGVTSMPEPTPPKVEPAGSLVLTTPSGETRMQSGLPWTKTLTVPAGSGDITVAAAADDTDSLTCSIKVDGREVAHQEVERGTVACRATP
jgi:hypothetical protein